jgi:hypothetical protein
MAEPVQASEESAVELPETRWWYCHVAGVLLWPVGLFMLLLAGLGDIGALIGVVLVLPLALMAGLGGFLGYYFDAKAIGRSSVEWSPLWWLYMLAHFILSPMLVAPIYLIQRHRHVGEP